MEKVKSVSTCCKGYKETEDDTKCTPICTPGCVEGKGTCVAPNNCQCKPNYGGPDCSLSEFLYFCSYHYSENEAKNIQRWNIVYSLSFPNVG